MLKIQADIVSVSLCLVPILVYLTVSGRISEFRAPGVEAKFNKLEDQLDAVRFILTLLLQRSDWEHLRNLVKGDTRGYEGRPSMRAELRKVRALGLIESIRGQPLGDMRNGLSFDLRNFVELTDRGNREIAVRMLRVGRRQSCGAVQNRVKTDSQRV